jgi:cyclophilin family peptidyl-prolyl cis-trans isomerase
MGTVRSLRLAVPVLALACACGRAEPAQGPGSPSATADAAQALVAPGAHDVAVLDLGPLGSMRIELLPELAPKSVASFVELAERGAYDGTSFHRVIPGFMIQGGDPLSRNKDPRDDGRGGGLDHRIPDEFSDYPHMRGTVSLAHSGTPNSAGSQFFIVHQDSRHLDGAYSVIGRVLSGMEAVDAVTRLPIDRYGRYGPPDRPYPESAVIRSLRIERAGAAASLAAPTPPG